MSGPPASPSEPARSTGPDLLHLSAGGSLYAVEVRFVEGVFQTGHVTRVPHGPECILGLVSLKGRIVPLLSIGRILGRAEKTRPGHPAVLLTWQDVRIALLADNVLGVRHLQPDAFHPAERAPGDPIAGTVATPEGDAGLLDVEAIVKLVRRMSERKAQQLGLGGLQ